MANYGMRIYGGGKFEQGETITIEKPVEKRITTKIRHHLKGRPKKK